MRSSDKNPGPATRFTRPEPHRQGGGRLAAGLVGCLALLGSEAAGAQEEDGLTLDGEGITLRFLEGRAELNLGGRLYLDLGDGSVSDDDAYDIFDKNVDITQARLELSGSYDGWLNGAYQYDLADNEAPLKDVALAVAWQPVVVTVGNVKEPFSLEEVTSDNDIEFMSRSVANAFAPGRNVGLAIAAAQDDWTAAAGIYGGNINESFEDGGTGITARVTYAPVRTERDIVHLGGSVGYRDLDSGEASFSTTPESDLFNASLVDTGTLDDAQSLTRFGLEAAWQRGPVRVQGEYVFTQVERDGGQGDPDFQGGYVMLAWVINGPGRPYGTELPSYGGELGRFEGVELDEAQRVTRGGYGVFELAGRLSGIDLDDKDVAGGRQGDLTLGLNWYPDENVRVMANYVRAEVDDAPETGGDEHADIFQMRLQVAF
ncbi:MAG TPA: porin [Geminicoccus sp.]|uniref:OprO/OprP family phosphate-selective porin n=1 Tax=Geminicoccus sp. TaxID=2024832 RepID=UPI002C2E9168|nr:porin [Geminicoccus sp.]HWL67632.1 porin [Geminicoccus sp.]